MVVTSFMDDDPSAAFPALLFLFMFHRSVPDFDIALVRLDRLATLISDDFASLVLPVCLEPPVVTTSDTK